MKQFQSIEKLDIGNVNAIMEQLITSLQELDLMCDPSTLTEYEQAYQQVE